MNDDFTILMSVYRKEKVQWLKESIESMLNQTVQAKEFLIIQDGPLTQELNEVLKGYKAQYPDYFRIVPLEKNVGLGLALQRGIEECKTELIIRMDSDDISIQDRCEKLLEKYREDPSLDMIGSYGTEFLDTLQNVIAVHKVPETSEEVAQFMKKRCAVIHPTVLYKKSAVLKAGNYQNVKLYEDYDLFSRMIFQQGAKAYNIQESLYYIRISDDFFRRRGGVQYMVTVLRFKWNQFRKGYMSFLDFCISGCGQAMVCLLPNTLRKKFYLTFLR